MEDFWGYIRVMFVMLFYAACFIGSIAIPILLFNAGLTEWVAIPMGIIFFMFALALFCSTWEEWLND
jgi:hypothetical protein